jgi:hypothetical protein
MKKQAARFLILTLMALPGLASAQRIVKAQVPFEFIANGKTMPAGPCTIVDKSDGNPYLVITSGKVSMFAITNPTESVKPYGQSKLVFHRYGNLYFLSSVVREGENRGHELRPGKAELELRAQAVRHESVTLVAEAR